MNYCQELLLFALFFGTMACRKDIATEYRPSTTIISTNPQIADQLKLQSFVIVEIIKGVCFQGHTSQDSFYKWTKISSHEINIFGCKNDGEKWSGIYFEIHRAPSELLLPSAKKSAQQG